MAPPRRIFQLGLFRRQNARAEMLEELDYHLQARVEYLVARGWAADEARREAEARFGPNLAAARKELVKSAEQKARRLDTRDKVRDFLADCRFAIRGFARAPAFTFVAVITLALGIGGNTAIYSAIDALLLRDLPYREPERLMDLSQLSDQGGVTAWSYPKLRWYTAEQTSFQTIALYGSAQANLTGEDPERIPIEEISATYLRTLGIDVAVGSDMPEEVDAGAGARRVVLLGHALWLRRFSGDSAVVGSGISMDNEVWEVAGILPQGFKGLTGRAELLRNVTARPPDALEEPWSYEFHAVARLAPGVTAEHSLAEADVLGARMQKEIPIDESFRTTSEAPDRWTVTTRELDGIRVSGGLRRSLLVLFGAVGLVLLIACVNLANLLLGRAISRRQEMAVRIALGASRGRLVRMLVTESVVLAALGGCTGLLVASVGARILSAVNPQETLAVQGLQGGVGAVGFDQIRLDGSALVFALLVTLLVGLLFGLVPALRATRADVNTDLKDGTLPSGFGRGAGKWRRALVVAEVALSLVLLAGSGLMLRSLGKLLSVDAGFDPSNVLTLRLAVPPGSILPDSLPGFYDEIVQGLSAVPGVEAVALSDCPPLNGGCNGTIMEFADRPQSRTGNAMVGVHWATPAWFATMKVPLRRGRMLNAGDRLGTAKVVLINEEAARRYFPGEDPLGKQVAVFQGGFHTGAEVVGIVGDVRYGTMDSAAVPDVYISYGQARIPRMMIFVRTTGDPTAAAPTVRAAVRRIAPRNPIYDIRPMSARMGAATAQARFSAVLLALFAAVALLLAVVGIYGVMSFAVAQRTREVGIRMALGASRADVLRLIMREGMLLGAAGIAVGLAAALPLTRLLREQLFETNADDPLTYAAMLLLIAMAIAVATWIPARRAASTAPVTAMRRA